MASILSHVLSIWISAERRRLVEVIPDPIRYIWDKWDLRGSLLVSFLCYAILSLLGSRRKSSASDLINSLVWASYLLSDWAANFALGVISDKVGDPMGHCGGDKNDPVLLAFWATFLLFHLSGPVTFAAEALEDNALWRRTLLLWLVQSARVLYITLLAWKITWLSYLNLAMFVGGVIYYGLKPWAQYSASIDRSHDMLIPSLNPTSSDDKYEVFVEDRRDLELLDIWEMKPQNLLRNFKVFYLSLSADHVLSYEYLQKHQSNFRRLKPEVAFEFVEIQLGYAYDVFYTKTSIAYTGWYAIFWILSGNIYLGAIICFGAIVNKNHKLSKIDHMITWTLLVGTLVLDQVASFAAVSFNDWNRSIVIRLARRIAMRLSRRTPQRYGPSDRELSIAFGDAGKKTLNRLYRSKRWSNAIAGGNLLTLCLQHNNMLGKSNKLHKLLRTRLCKIDDHLKEYIFHNLVNKPQSLDAIDARGLNSIEWTKKLEFHQGILTWHIATDLCYHGIGDIQEQGPMADHSKVRSISKSLSDYMLYILVKQRQMLPVGMGLVSFRDTCDETMRFIQRAKREKPLNSVEEVCQKLLLDRPDQIAEERSPPKSVLLDACKLAQQLRRMETQKIWEFLADKWVEILAHAATHRWPEQHAQQLRKGGQFLTHVWLLSAHLGLIEQLQVEPTHPSEEQSTSQRNELVHENNNETRVQIPEHGTGERETEEEHIL